MRSLFPESSDNRRLQDWRYVIEAIRALKGRDDEPSLWAVELRPNGDFRRTTLLVEIGRWMEPEKMVTIAEVAYEHRQYPIREVVRLIRGWRLGQEQ